MKICTGIVTSTPVRMMPTIRDGLMATMMSDPNMETQTAWNKSIRRSLVPSIAVRSKGVGRVDSLASSIASACKRGGNMQRTRMVAAAVAENNN